MSNNELNEIIRNMENQIRELENLVANGGFSKNEVVRIFKDNTPSARAGGINILYNAVTEVAEKAKGLEKLEQMFPTEPSVTELKKRFARCGQYLISMINMIEEWG